MDTCASDIYTPSISDLDADSSSTHSRITDQLSVQQADGTTLVSSGLGTLARAPAYVMPTMSDTLLGAKVVCKLVDHEKVLCVGSDANTGASLTDFYEFIRRSKNLIKITTFEENGCYKVLRSKTRPLNSKKQMAKLISRYETVQFSDFYHFVRFWHRAMGHADIKTMLLIASYSHRQQPLRIPRFSPGVHSTYYSQILSSRLQCMSTRQSQSTSFQRCSGHIFTSRDSPGRRNGDR